MTASVFQLVQIIIGFVVLSITIRILKHEVKQPRPSTECKNYNPFHGWPSGHTALAAYFATVVSIFAFSVCTNPVREHKQLNCKILATLIFILSIILVVSVAKTRIIQKCHTKNQTKYGAMFGVLIGVLAMNTSISS